MRIGVGRTIFMNCQYLMLLGLGESAVSSSWKCDGVHVPEFPGSPIHLSRY